MFAINQLTIVFGILITNLINYQLSDLGQQAWRWMFGFGTIPSLLFVTGVIWLPESPAGLSKQVISKREAVLIKSVIRIC